MDDKSGRIAYDTTAHTHTEREKYILCRDMNSHHLVSSSLFRFSFTPIELILTMFFFLYLCLWFFYRINIILVVEIVDRPKPPYLLIDSRRLDAGNIFVPVKENSELTLACISEGGNPKPILSWEVLISPGVDRHSQKVSAEVLELQEIKNEVKSVLFSSFFPHSTAI